MDIVRKVFIGVKREGVEEVQKLVYTEKLTPEGITGLNFKVVEVRWSLRGREKDEK